jgi:HTH-type transcriptional regulator/antitoxin HigA
MNVRPIKTDADYAWALAEIERYFDDEPAPGSEGGDRFEILVDLVAAYEERTIPLPEVEPIDALTAFMEMHGKSQSDLAALLGSRPRASEILNRKRALTIEMVHRLNRDWGVPAELLIAPYKLAA